MSNAHQTDCLIVVNGPEDGSEFPILRSPFDIGSDSSCSICIQLDETVELVHAHVNAVAEGYCVRSAGGPPVYVDGKRAGMVVSRIARSGSSIQVGETELVCLCAPGGLASRSKGIPRGNDALWALKQGAKGLEYTLLRIGRGCGGTLRFAGRHWLLVVGAGVVLYFLWPDFRAFVQGLYYYIYQEFNARLP